MVEKGLESKPDDLEAFLNRALHLHSSVESLLLRAWYDCPGFEGNTDEFLVGTIHDGGLEDFGSDDGSISLSTTRNLRRIISVGT